MKKKFYQVDAFTNKAYSGNAAGVIVDAKGLSNNQMQLIAKEMKLSETVFVFPGGLDYDFELRFFTPSEEVDLCGHATIATFSLLKQLGIIDNGKKELVQKTKAGKLNVKFLEDGSVLMLQADPVSTKSSIPIEELSQVMGISSEDIGIEDLMELPEIWSTGLSDILLPVQNIKTLKKLTPLMDKLAKLSRRYNVVGVHAFTIDENSQVWCRNFAPAYDIPEESATGTSNGALGACLHSKGWKSENTLSFIAHQGDWMGSPSRISVQVIGDDFPKIWVGGSAVTILEGEILLPR